MIRFVAGKLASSLVTILAASIIAFIVMRVLPGSPVRLIVGALASQAEVNNTQRALGLNQSIPVQYWDFISNFVRGDWGFSYSVGEPVRSLLATRFPASLELGCCAFLLAFGGAIVFAILSLTSAWADKFVRSLTFLGLGTPVFWLALILLVIFSQSLHLLPGPEGRLSINVQPPPTITGFYTIDSLVTGRFGALWNAIEHLILPALCLAFTPFSFLVRLLRSNLLDVTREQFMTVARSKGVSRSLVILRHGLPNAFLPTLTASALIFAELLAGSVLVETVFDWPGVGALVVQSLENKDYVVMQTFILLSAILYVIVNLIVDLLYGAIDPRIRLARVTRP
jgi:peptide/nickel transport system permease protein